MNNPTSRKLDNEWSLRLVVGDDHTARWFLIYCEAGSAELPKAKQIQVSDTTALACILNAKGSNA